MKPVFCGQSPYERETADVLPGALGRRDEKLGTFSGARWIFPEPLASWATPLRLLEAVMLSTEQMRGRKTRLSSAVPAD